MLTTRIRQSMKFLTVTRRLHAAIVIIVLSITMIGSASAQSPYSEAIQLIGHSSTIRSIDFSRDGRRVVTGSDDGSVKVWDATTGSLLYSYPTVGITWARFSPDGTKILVWGQDPVIKLIDVESGTEVRKFTGHVGLVFSARFNSDASAIVSTGLDHIRIWDVASGTESITATASLRFTAGTVQLQFHDANFNDPQGTVVAVSTNWIVAWKIAPLDTIGIPIKATGVSGEQIEVSRDGSQLLSVGERAVVVFDAKTGDTVQTIPAPGTGMITGCAVNSQWNYVAVRGTKPNVGIYDLRAGIWVESEMIRTQTGRGSRVMFDSSGTRLALNTIDSGSPDSVVIWTLPQTLAAPLRPSVPVTSLSCRPNPLVGTGVIAYSVAHADWYDIELTDIVGRTIRTVDRVWREPGEYSQMLDGIELSPGTYLCRIRSTQGIRTVPLIVSH